ncbi:hypothetical protein D8674_007836 [Pyrus ussuriensis x Pyrus communis]|uniref:Uncharacterized protein n=1 Tax=Pyrus ussuriensis x Pyrus communis TaxID=2448454 RepID=A0A5N5HTY3_9ROSA|nr:hypothetical protein D8674_007836 [Pyrus ussuriensis x Pyrus communis]
MVSISLKLFSLSICRHSLHRSQTFVSIPVKSWLAGKIRSSLNFFSFLIWIEDDFKPKRLTFSGDGTLRFLGLLCEAFEALCAQGYDETSNNWDDYLRYVNPEGVEFPLLDSPLLISLYWVPILGEIMRHGNCCQMRGHKVVYLQNYVEVAQGP